MMPRFHTRRAIAFMIVAFLLQPLPLSPSAEESILPVASTVTETATPTVSPPSITFTDIQGHWAEAAIQKAVAAGIVKGYGDGTFRPDQPITNAEFRLMLHRSAPSAGALYGALYAGDDLHSRTDPNTSNLDTPITRQSAAWILAQALPIAGATDRKLLSAYPDVTLVADWAQEAMSTIITTGYLTGHDDGYLRPDRILSRAEGATLLMRVIDSNETLTLGTYQTELLNSAEERGDGHVSSASTPQAQTPTESSPPQNESPSVTSTYLIHLGNIIHPGLPATHNEAGGSTPRLRYIVSCFSRISPTRSFWPGDSKHSITSSLSKTPCKV